MDVQRVSHLTHSPHQHRSHIQLATHGLRINLFAFVTKGSRARDDSQLLQLGQAVNQRLRDALGQVFCVRIIARIRERQDRDGINRFGRSREVEEISETGNRYYQHGQRDYQTSLVMLNPILQRFGDRRCLCCLSGSSC